jgi:hypothetical protein
VDAGSTVDERLSLLGLSFGCEGLVGRYRMELLPNQDQWVPVDELRKREASSCCCRPAAVAVATAGWA